MPYSVSDSDPGERYRRHVNGRCAHLGIWSEPESDAVRLAGEVVALYECRQRWTYRLWTHLEGLYGGGPIPDWAVKAIEAASRPLAWLSLRLACDAAGDYTARLRSL